jgi:hypothetical protein
MSARRAWRRFEVAFTGPFFSGQPLRVRLADYSRLQREICEELNRSSDGWDHEGIKWRGVESYGSGGGYSTLVPLVLLRREGDGLERRLEELQRQRPEDEQRWLRDASAGWSWTLRSVQIELYDFGVGTITGIYDVRAPLRLAAEEIRYRAESVGRLLQDPDRAAVARSPVAAAHEMLARETVGLFREAIARCAPEERQEPWLQPLLTALPPTADHEAEDEWGRLLWLHPVFVLTAGEGASLARLHRISRPFEATFSRRIEHWHGLFTPGIDSSAIVLYRNRPKEKKPPMGLTLLMWAYYGLFMEIDRGLLAMLDSDRWHHPTSLAELEADADRMFAIYMRVQEARSRLDSALTDLAGGHLSMWSAISEVQKFGELVAAVEGKVSVLQRVAERRVQEANAARARRTGNVLSGLTALTVVTLAIAAMTAIGGTRTDESGDLDWRIATIGAAFVLAAIIFAITLVGIGRTPTRRRGR